MLLTALAHFVNKAGACSMAAPLPRPPPPAPAPGTSPGCGGYVPPLCPVHPWAPLPPAPRLCELRAPPVTCSAKSTEGAKK